MTATLRAPVAAPIWERPRSTLLRHSIWAILGLIGFYLLSVSLSPFHDLQLAQIS